MIRVTLELVPGGVGEPEHLGTIFIANQIRRSLDNPRRGDYEFQLWKKRTTGRPKATGLIEDFPRQAYHPWNLVKEVLDLAAVRNGGRI